MTPQVRLRRHIDGRVALHTPNAYRFCWFCRSEDTPKCQWLTDEEVDDPGWSELFVAELPEPSGSVAPQCRTDREALKRTLTAAFQSSRVIARSRGNAGREEWDVATLNEAHRLADVAMAVLRDEGFGVLL